MDEFTTPPDAVILTGPAGSGKTEAAIGAILDERAFAGFKPIWVLLASGEQAHSVRARLVQRSADQVQFGVEFFTFESLYHRVLDLLGDPQQQVEDTARYRLLRHVVEDLDRRGALEHFGPVAKMPGFIGLVAGLIHELKQGLVLPERFTAAADARGPKDRDLARIYHAYQRFLQDRQLVDRHGAGWLAVDHLERGAALPVDVGLLVVDGFDQFNQVHIRLLTELARRIPRTVLTLTHAPEEPGRRFRRFEQVRRRLLAWGAKTGRQVWRVEALPPPAARAPALDHLVREIFRIRPDRLADGGGALTLIEAPDIPREVAAVLRRVKRRLLDGAPPDSIAIIARDLAPYAGALRETARAYGLPLVARQGARLRENPVVALLLALIDLHRRDFPRRDVLDILHSPYLDSPDLDADAIARLERISMERQVVRGREAWLDAAARSAQPRPVEDAGESPGVLAPDDARALRDALAHHFDRITPPPRGTAYTFTAWLERLVGPDPEADALDAAEEEEGAPQVPRAGHRPAPTGDREPRDHFNLLGRIRDGDDPERTARDVTALRAWARVLAGIRSAHDLLAGDGPLPVMDWGDFRAELELAVDESAVTPPGGLGRLGRVLATGVREARGLPHDHVFLLGLAEGMFPAQESQGGLYQEGERRQLETAGIDMLTAVERADEQSLFYQALGLARRSLTISRYYVDDKGTPVPPSPYWDAICAAVAVCEDHVRRIPVGAAPGLDDAATPGEAAIAAAAALSRAADPAPALAVHNALLGHPAWRAVLRGRALEARREDPASPFDHFGGVLRQPGLIAAAAARLGPDRVWSASQLNDYGVCPFRFFARRLLALEQFEEPEEGLDPAQIGSIHHAILEATYRQIGAENLAITPENQGRALTILEEQARAIFETAPEVYGFRPSALWQHEQADMQRRLARLVARDFSEDSPLRLGTDQRPASHPVAVLIDGETRRPFGQEARFGFDEAPPLAVDGPAGPVWVRGVIDRLDRAGDRVVVIDYKTGTTPHPVRDMAAGRDFQMMVYLLAAREVAADRRVAGGLFWHINNQAVSGEVAADDPAVEEARARLHVNIQAARAGRYAALPNRGRCANFCEFGALCRVSRGALRKAAPG